jgi:hypothetical protein
VPRPPSDLPAIKASLRRELVNQNRMGNEVSAPSAKTKAKRFGGGRHRALAKRKDFGSSLACFYLKDAKTVYTVSIYFNGFTSHWRTLNCKLCDILGWSKSTWCGIVERSEWK